MTTRFVRLTGQDQCLLTVSHFYSGLEKLILLKHNQSCIKRAKLKVGTRQTSVFRYEYFIQDMLLHMPHTSTNEFRLPGFEQIPQVIRYFVCALHHQGSVWTNQGSIGELFELEGHKSWYIANILVHNQSLKELHAFYQNHAISFRELTFHSVSDLPLDPKQKLVVLLVKKCLIKEKSIMHLFIRWI